MSFYPGSGKHFLIGLWFVFLRRFPARCSSWSLNLPSGSSFFCHYLPRLHLKKACDNITFLCGNSFHSPLSTHRELEAQSSILVHASVSLESTISQIIYWPHIYLISISIMYKQPHTPCLLQTYLIADTLSCQIFLSHIFSLFFTKSSVQWKECTVCHLICSDILTTVTWSFLQDWFQRLVLLIFLFTTRNHDTVSSCKPQVLIFSTVSLPFTFSFQIANFCPGLISSCNSFSSIVNGRKLTTRVLFSNLLTYLPNCRSDYWLSKLL